MFFENTSECKKKIRNATIFSLHQIVPFKIPRNDGH